MFSKMPIDKNMIEELESIGIEYAFQPIFHPDGKSIFAYEALMRPKNKDVSELISEYKDNLHVLEVATFFGATKAYIKRGYNEPVCINSFPSEHFSTDEIRAYFDCFGNNAKKGIVEILEYPKTSLRKWQTKKDSLWSQVAIDDFGSGKNNMDAVRFFKPQIVKLDRSLISEVDSNKEKQESLSTTIELLKNAKVLIVAEGVEKKDEFNYLVSKGVNLFQGYYLARPQ